MGNPLIANIIIAAFLIGSLIGINHMRKYFGKKEKYRDVVGASRKQHELIGRRKK